MEIHWRKLAGIIAVDFGKRWCLHLGVASRDHWVWGHAVEEYDLVLDYWGLGPVFLLVRSNLK